MKKKHHGSVIQKRKNTCVQARKNWKQKRFPVVEEAKKVSLHDLLSDEVAQLKRQDMKAEKNQQQVFLTGSASILFWLYGVLIVFVGYLAFLGLDIIYLIVAALIISMAMEVVIHTFRKRIARGPAVVVSYIFLVLFVFSGIIILIPFLLTQTSILINSLVEYINGIIILLETGGIQALLEKTFLPVSIQQDVMEYFRTYGTVNALQTSITDNLSNILNVSKSIGEFATNFVVDAVGLFFNGIFKVMMVVVLALFFSLEKNQLVRFLAGIAGPRKQTYWELKLQLLYKKLGQWLKSQIMVSLFIGTLVYIFLWIISPWINLDGKLSLALIAALTAIIPYLGPFLGGLPAIVAGTIAYGLSGFFTIFFVYLLVQQIEGNLFTPFFMKKQLGISPVLIMIVVLLGGITLGAVGVILAVPLTVIITLLANDDFS